MEACLGNPLTYVADHWWQMALMIFACSFAIFLADVTGLNRPWPLSVILGGILAQLILEGYPCAYLILGDYTIVPLWAVTACMVYFWPAFLAGEVGLALLESLYSRQHLAEVRAAKTADKKADTHELDATIAALTDQLEQQSRRIQTLHQQANSAGQAFANGQMQAAHGHGTGSNNGRRTGDLDLANDARAAQKQQRKAAIPEVLAAVGMPLSTGELRDQLQHMHGWEISADSVRRYCQELEAEGIVESERRKWQLTGRQYLAQLPVQTAVGVAAVNGAGAG